MDILETGGVLGGGSGGWDREPPRAPGTECQGETLQVELRLLGRAPCRGPQDPPGTVIH